MVTLSMKKLRFSCICLSVLTIFVYVVLLLIVRSSLRSCNFLDSLQKSFLQVLALVLAVYSAWIISTIYMDVYLWFRRNFKKDDRAIELLLYSGTEGGGEDFLISKQASLACRTDGNFGTSLAFAG